MSIFLSLYFLLLLQYSANGSNEPNQVKVEGIGIMQGTVLKSVHGRKFVAFRGIPYAEPPIGDLRFKPPVAKLPWLGSGEVFDASEDAPYCTQMNIHAGEIIGKEDCLYLNVYTHDLNPKKLRPVMVSIHGGGFLVGTGRSNVFGPGKLLDKDIVLVTLNYRLNVLGFLSTSDKASPGNYGLMDQMEAMKWVKRNIQAFGGDPNSITIFGESAGGASVYYQVLSPLTKGLFHRAIAMSGSPYSPWAFRPNPLQQSKSLGNLLGCPVSGTEELVQCLRGKPAEELVQKSLGLGKVMVSFNPVVDGHFITDHPKNLFERGEIANVVPMLTGVTKDEGLTFYLTFRMSPEPYTIETIGNAIAYALNVDEINDDVKEAVKELYIMRFGVGNDVKLLSEIFGDAMFKIPHYIAAKHLVHLGFKTYVYSYNYIGLNGITRSIPNANNVKGCGHGDDLYMLFDGDLFSPNMKNEDDPGHHKFIDLWVNFATYGDPTPAEMMKEENLKWESAEDGKFPVFQLDETLSVMPYNKEDDKLVDFWSKKIPNLLKLKIKEEL